MRAVGTVLAIQVTTAGSWTTGANLTSSTTLTIQDMSDFREEGGTAVIDDITVTYLAAVDDEDGDYLTLADPLTADVADRTAVAVSPLVQFKSALVDIGGGLVYECDIPSGHLWADDRLAETATGGQSVEVERDDGSAGTWTVVKILGSAPIPDLTFSKPSSLPAAAVDQDDFVRHKIVADIITATDMTAATMTGATIQTARPEDTGRRTWMDQDGFHQTSSGGVPRIDFPTTTGGKNFIRGSANLDDVTLLGPGVVRDDFTISPGGGTITLGTSLSDPSSSPVSLCDWEGVAVVRDAVPSYGLQRGSGVWYYAQAGGLGGNKVSVRSFADDGTTDTQIFSHSGGPPAGGVAKVGTNWFVMQDGGAGDYWHLNKYNASGDLVATSTLGATSLMSMVVGTDGTDLFAAWVFNGVVNINTYNTALGATGHVTTTLALDNMTPLAYVSKGNFDFGATRFVVAARGSGTGIPGIGAATGTAYVLNSSGVEQTAESFPIADSANSLAGMTWDGTNFWSMHDGSPKLYKYTDGCKADTGDNLTLWVSGDWYQVAGTYHTKVSPAAKVTYVKRSRLQSSMGGVPGSGGVDDPDTTQTFIGRGASDPGPAGSYLNATSATDSGDTIVESPVFSGTTAPTTNTFPDAGASGRVLAGDGSVILRGTYSNADDVETRLDTLEAGGGGGTPLGGVDIDCGTASATGVEIDCGVA